MPKYPKLEEMMDILKLTENNRLLIRDIADKVNEKAAADMLLAVAAAVDGKK